MKHGSNTDIPRTARNETFNLHKPPHRPRVGGGNDWKLKRVDIPSAPTGPVPNGTRLGASHCCKAMYERMTSNAEMASAAKKRLAVQKRGHKHWYSRNRESKPDKELWRNLVPLGPVPVEAMIGSDRAFMARP